MNNLKKIGLTALGTALVTSTAVAGSLDVTGTAGITYVGNSGADNGGSKLTQKTTVSFTGSASVAGGASDVLALSSSALPVGSLESSVNC